MSWQMLLTYWRDKHAGGKPPARADLDPLAEITTLVPNLFLIDVVGDGFRMRLVGSEIMLRTGVDMTGTLMAPDAVDARGMEAWLGFLRRVVRECRPVLYALKPERAAPGATGLVVPLVNDGVVDMILGGLFFDATANAGEQPHLFLLEPGELVIPTDLSETPQPARPSARKSEPSAS